MNAEQAKEVLRYITATWRIEMTDDQAASWMETLADVLPGHAREAVRNLKRVKTIVPNHAEFFEAVEAIAHRLDVEQQEIESGETGGTICPECDGNGWVEVDRVGQGHVIRCPRCNPEAPRRAPDGSPIQHKSGCSCSRCHYGPKRYAAILAGRDGMPARVKTPVANQEEIF